MTGHHARFEEEVQGQAAFGMANLRSQRTDLPFIVFISQKGGAQDDVRVKVSPEPKVRGDQMGSYALRPYRHVGGTRLTRDEEQALERWVDANIDILVQYWDGDIEYTKDALELVEGV